MQEPAQTSAQVSAHYSHMGQTLRKTENKTDKIKMSHNSQIVSQKNKPSEERKYGLSMDDVDKSCKN